MKKCVLVLVVFAIFTPCLHSQSVKRFRVYIQADLDDTLKNRIESALNRELRNLGDVAISPLDAFIGIKIVGFRLNDIKGYSAGFALAVAFVFPYDLAEVKKYLEKSSSPDFAISPILRLYWLGDKGDSLDSLFLYVGSESDLDSTCREIVARFDNKILQPIRISDQMLMDAIKETKEKYDKTHPKSSTPVP